MTDSMNSYRTRMRRVVGVPERPADVPCPGCGFSCRIVTSTRYDFAEPCFYGWCETCRRRVCPQGHFLERTASGIGFHRMGDTDAIACLHSESCGDIRLMITAHFEILAHAWEGSAETEEVLSFWRRLADKADESIWLHSVAMQVPKAHKFFVELSRQFDSPSPGEVS